jgi:hypothetical protein
MVGGRNPRRIKIKKKPKIVAVWKKIAIFAFELDSEIVPRCRCIVLYTCHLDKK